MTTVFDISIVIIVVAIAVMLLGEANKYDP